MNPRMKTYATATALLLAVALFAQPTQAQDDQAQEQHQFQKKISHLQQQLREAHKQLRSFHEKFEAERRKHLPPLENGLLQVFQLREIDPVEVAEILNELLGPAQLRMAPDSEHSRLLVYARQKILDEISALIQQFDVPEDPNSSQAKDDKYLAESLMVRIFWLSDGATYPDAQPANNFLPNSVTEALKHVGIAAPFLVLQSNTSIALNEDGAASFHVHDLPVNVFNDRLRFSAEGEVHAVDTNQIRLRMETATERTVGNEPIAENHIGGSMVAPLNHFMVLGTTNYAAPTSHEGVTSKSTDATSRFAFVVQVIEAKSFTPDE